MKTYLKVIRLTLLSITCVLLFSCEKTGSEGPAGQQGLPGPKLKGNIFGYISHFDQYGTRIYNNMTGDTVRFEDTTLITTTDTNGKYQFNNLYTGQYSISVSRQGFGAIKDVSFQFLGGGDLFIRDLHISKIPNFAVSTLSATVNGTDVVISGSLSVSDTKPRSLLLFFNTISNVSSDPNNYIFMLTKNVTATSVNFSMTVPSEDIHNSGFPAGTTLYIAAYGVASNFANSSSYQDPITGRNWFTAISSTAAKASVTIP